MRERYGRQISTFYYKKDGLEIGVTFTCKISATKQEIRKTDSIIQDDYDKSILKAFI